jgi:predicted RNase H-like nuclease (RuvC/YqgF family)
LRDDEADLKEQALQKQRIEHLECELQDMKQRIQQKTLVHEQIVSAMGQTQDASVATLQQALKEKAQKIDSL